MAELRKQCTDVLLVVGVPTDKAGFRVAWDRGSDYLRHAYRDPESGWTSYQKSAAVARQVCAECASLGATVILDATLGALAIGESFSVVTVVTHMAFPLVDSLDVRGPAELLGRVASGDEPEWQLIRQQSSGSKDLGEVLVAINYLLEQNQRRLDTGPVRRIRDAERIARHLPEQLKLVRLDRPRLDELCGKEILAPALGIEMADGMHSCAELVATFPADFRGLADLRMCNSISVGSQLSRARPLMWGVAVGRRSARLDAGLLLFKTALLQMTRSTGASQPSPHRYEEAMRTVTEALR